MFLTALLIQVAPMAMHADKPRACPATPAPLPSGWAAMTPVTAGGSSDSATPLPLGRGARATLQPTSQVRLAVPTAKPAALGSHGGMLAFTVPAAGRYRVALGAGVWIDVVANGAALVSAAHGHGPACSPVKKMVDFDLKPGRYLLQVVGSTAPTLAMMVSPAK